MQELLGKKQTFLNEAEMKERRLLKKIDELNIKMEKNQMMISDLENKNEDLKDILSGLLLHSNKPERNIVELAKKKIIVVGGHPNWIKKFKSDQNLIFIENDLNFDEKILADADMIAICYSYMSHALYKKVITFARKNSLSVGYIKNTNEKLSLLALS